MLEYIGWSKPFAAHKTSIMHCTALFVLRAKGETVSANWAQAYHARTKVCNWFCAHSWFKFVPFLDEARMTKEKALRETRSGRFLPVATALKALDHKNRAVLQRLVDLGTFD